MDELHAATLLHEGTTLEGRIAAPDGPGPHPTVLVFPTAFGLGDQIRDVAQRLAAKGYFALAADMFGHGLYSEDQRVIGEVIEPLWGTELLRSRVVAWLGYLRERSAVAVDRIAAIGYCFGGQCVLELARSGADVKVFVSFHGILATSNPARPGTIRGQVAVYTGGKDPHVPRAHVDALRDELTAAGADWNITEFANAYHAFTDPEADTPDTGREYDMVADRVSWAGMQALLDTILQPELAGVGESKAPSHHK